MLQSPWKGSPLVSEIIAPPPGVFYCDHDADCLDNFRLPALVCEMLMNDTSLMLLVGKHTSNKAGKVVQRGKGWRVCKVVA